MRPIPYDTSPPSAADRGIACACRIIARARLRGATLGQSRATQWAKPCRAAPRLGNVRQRSAERCVGHARWGNALAEQDKAEPGRVPQGKGNVSQGRAQQRQGNAPPGNAAALQCRAGLRGGNAAQCAALAMCRTAPHRDARAMRHNTLRRLGRAEHGEVLRGFASANGKGNARHGLGEAMPCVGESSSGRR